VLDRAILTKNEAEKIINTQNLGHSQVFLSLDLGKSQEKVILTPPFVLLCNQKILLKELEKLKENTIYVAEDNTLKSIDFFSNDTNLYYKLKPTHDWPTLTISSVPMHRFKQISPKTSAELMVKEIAPVKGLILDTCCGLGYTSILLSKEAEKVFTFEKDSNVLRIAEYNPYSKKLFNNPKIELVNNSILEGIKSFENNYFDRVLHDPPTTSFGEELYSKSFYLDLFRVMKRGALLYHYCPNPGKTKGQEFFPLLIKRLEEAGFSNCKYNKNSSGIKAQKK